MATNKLAFTGERDSVSNVQTPTPTKSVNDGIYLVNGSPFTGTVNGKTYDNGRLVTTSAPTPIATPIAPAPIVTPTSTSTMGAVGRGEYTSEYTGVTPGVSVQAPVAMGAVKRAEYADIYPTTAPKPPTPLTQPIAPGRAWVWDGKAWVKPAIPDNGTEKDYTEQVQKLNKKIDELNEKEKSLSSEREKDRM